MSYALAVWCGSMLIAAATATLRASIVAKCQVVDHGIERRQSSVSMPWLFCMVGDEHMQRTFVGVWVEPSLGENVLNADHSLRHEVHSASLRDPHGVPDLDGPSSSI